MYSSSDTIAKSPAPPVSLPVSRFRETFPVSQILAAPTLGPTMRCHNCGRQVAIRRTWRGGRILLDPRPDPAGHHLLRDKVAVAVNDRERGQALEAGETVYRNHFARCRQGSR